MTSLLGLGILALDMYNTLFTLNLYTLVHVAQHSHMVIPGGVMGVVPLPERVKVPAYLTASVSTFHRGGLMILREPWVIRYPQDETTYTSGQFRNRASCLRYLDRPAQGIA